jgi:hypothetical protein
MELNHIRARGPRRVTPELFIACWQLARSVTAVAAALGRHPRKVRAWERRLRRAGVRLKDLPALAGGFWDLN